jgi:uncharacterized repeat protein (TIGR01451 family)
MTRRVAVVFVGVVLAGLLMVTPAFAESPWWHVSSGARPTHLPPGGSGDVVVYVTNLGDATVNGSSAPVTISDVLPQGLTPTSVSASAGLLGSSGGAECTVTPLSCTFSGTLPPYEQIEVTIAVEVGTNVAAGAQNEVSVSGGGAPAVSVSRPVTVDSTPTPYGVEDYELLPENAGGSPDTQAGSHPFQLTTVLALNQTADPTKPPALVKDLHFQLPPGLIGNPTPFPRCKDATFADNFNFIVGCPSDTVLGVALVTLDEPAFFGAVTVPVPVYNLAPSTGEPARFGFEVLEVPVILNTAVRTGGDYGVTVSVSNISEVPAFAGSLVTLWGDPGDPRHDSTRNWACLGNLWPADTQGTTGETCKPLGESNPPPFLTLPTSCGSSPNEPLSSSVTTDSWADPAAVSAPSVYRWHDDAGAPLALDGCNRLSFEPSLGVAPDGPASSTPTGLTVGVHLPQEAILTSNGLAQSDLRNTTVTLPAGVQISPAGADGLSSCSLEQIGLESASAPACPEASKIGTVELTTPLLTRHLEGAVYLAAQDANPFGSLVAMYIVVEDPQDGILIKFAGEVTLDEHTGQIVSTFKNTPQLPFEDLKLHFFGSARAPLSTPALCGGYTTKASFGPWSGNAPAEPTSTFDITSGPNGSACPSTTLPFSPSLTAGTTNIQAGAFSPFTMTVSREDGQQNIGSMQLHMPPGLSGLLSGVELCGEAQADAGTCGPNSLIGETTVSVGLGGDPYSVTGGKVYITGPYESAPFGISVVVPAKAGPYNLGQVVVRGRIEVNPITAALTITTNSQAQGYAIPHILDGIPLEIKHVNFITTRSGFTFNPTNCDPMGVTGSISSVEGSSSAVSVPFQVTNCAVLAFKPGFTVSTSGKTSRAEGASLNVKLTYPKAPFGSQANVKSVKVDLPKQLPSRLTTLQKACPAKTFEANPADCPVASIVGHATAITPLIPVPLTGPAYFVSYGGAKFPELVVVLQGYGVTLDLHGETFISKAGITSSTFHTIPDAPVGSFELTLPEGKYSALAANGNLCKSSLKMPTAFTAQNGTEIHESTKISVTGCAKLKKKAKKSSKHHKGKSHGKKK